MTNLFGKPIEPDFESSRETRKERTKRVLWIGLGLLLGYGLFRSLTVQALQAYLATGVVYGFLVYVKWGSHFRERWFWTAIVASVPVHTIYIIGLFWCDKLFPEVMMKPLGFTPVLIVGCAIEMVLIDTVIRRLRPALPQ